MLSLFLCSLSLFTSFFFFFNDTATTEIYTLSLHDALPISRSMSGVPRRARRASSASRSRRSRPFATGTRASFPPRTRSEEHTSELQSRPHLVCRLLLEKKKKKIQVHMKSTSYNTVSRLGGR